MTVETGKIQLFEDQQIRTAWNETEEECFFFIVGVVKVMTEQPDARHASTYVKVKEGQQMLPTRNSFYVSYSLSLPRKPSRSSCGWHRWAGSALTKILTRNYMSTTELVINMLVETATRDFSEAEKPQGFKQSVSVAKRDGKVAGDARKAIEAGTGKPIITNKKAAELNHVVTEMIEASAGAVEKGEKDNEV